MIVVHLCLSGPYTDNWGYQENLLPLYQAKAGHAVFVIATNTAYGLDGEIVEKDCGEYLLDGGVRIVRVRPGRLLTRKIGLAYGYYRILDILRRLRPDFIMIHGLMSVTAFQAILYKMLVNRRCVLVADTHLDIYCAPTRRSGLRSGLFRASISLFGWFYATQCRELFGITPGCIDYAVRRHRIAPTRFKLLPLGADTDRIEFARQAELRQSVRRRYGIPLTDRIMIFGGKLDAAKNVRSLVQAAGSANVASLTLVVFGSVHADLLDAFNADVDRYRDRVRYVGFLGVEDIYNLFLAADLAAFPGTESALWQQAIACGLPAIFKWWPGIEYLDVGGNCTFIRDPDADSIRKVIEHLFSDSDRLETMAEVARRQGVLRFSYRSLAAQVLAQG
jgi:1,2-diacylglycerol 3-alpha-glucosyltransferase